MGLWRFKDIAEAINFMAENLKEAVREAAKEIYQIGIITGETRYNMTKQLRKELNQKGFTVYYDSKGKYISFREYADSLLSEQWVGFVDAAG
jgi:diphthamide synthase subunit DPH2